VEVAALPEEDALPLTTALAVHNTSPYILSASGGQWMAGADTTSSSSLRMSAVSSHSKTGAPTLKPMDAWRPAARVAGSGSAHSASAAAAAVLIQDLSWADDRLVVAASHGRALFYQVSPPDWKPSDGADAGAEAGADGVGLLTSPGAGAGFSKRPAITSSSLASGSSTKSGGGGSSRSPIAVYHHPTADSSSSSAGGSAGEWSAPGRFVSSHRVRRVALNALDKALFGSVLNRALYVWDLEHPGKPVAAETVPHPPPPPPLCPALLCSLLC
jgi:hypothetical protein